MPRDIPGWPETTATTPSQYMMACLLGGVTFEGVTYSKDQFRSVQKLYGFSEAALRANVEASRLQHEVATKLAAEKALTQPSWQHAHQTAKPFDEESIRRFLNAGDERNAWRFAQRDGLRMLGAIGKYVEPGQDPVKFIVGLLIDAGYDVDPADYEWATAESIEEDPDPQSP